MRFKKCTKCGKEKPINEFDKKGNKHFSRCKSCRHEQYMQEREKNTERANLYYKNNREKVLIKTKERKLKNAEKGILASARKRAKKKGFEFNLEENDINIPDICPVLNIPLVKGNCKAGPNSPSIDRIYSDKGYIKGNVIIVSNLANTIKSNATPEQIRKVADYYEKLQNQLRI